MPFLKTKQKQKKNKGNADMSVVPEIWGRPARQSMQRNLDPLSLRAAAAHTGSEIQ